jgi:hypothetical protein
MTPAASYLAESPADRRAIELINLENGGCGEQRADAEHRGQRNQDQN